MKSYLPIAFLFTILSKLSSAQATKTCPDGNICYNGSICTKIDNGYTSKIEGRQYRCDCSYELTSGSDFYAGYGCEFAAEDYCYDGVYATTEEKSNAICTNGKCIENIYAEEDGKFEFKGCECEDGYEGDFCEFEAGKGIIKKNKKNTSGRDFAIALPVVGLVVVGAFYWNKRRKSSSQNDSSPAVEMKEEAEII
ncbi:hypothetical protein CTEN210_04414 [Chaetoceros tenuissimus]|uniref:EGF-like domain-containing protein n=1 Tax=Chaetoceros tenuissimus TaxID=426638 RepID=A0AAD3CLT8_9STRA|nr:hypothetical protein CTEN210_04414 [Chaetoceros tenuissimus]